MANQKGADADHRVLVDADDEGFLIFDGELETFPLADWVVAESDHAVLGEQDRGSLIRLGCLAVDAMATGNENARERPLAVRDEEVAGDVMIGPALVDHLLDAEAVPLEGADDLAVERRLVGKATDRGDELRLQLGLPLVDVVGGLEGSDRLLACIEVLLRFAE